MPSPRRFPAPWSAEVQPNYYVVRDADGQQIAYVYFENEPGRRSAAKLLTKDGLADANNHLSRKSKMSLTGSATVGELRPAERGAAVP
jgi:hypothetical protein